MKSTATVKLIFENKPKDEISLKPQDLDYNKLLLFVQKKLPKGASHTINYANKNMKNCTIIKNAKDYNEKLKTLKGSPIWRILVKVKKAAAKEEKKVEEIPQEQNITEEK